MESGELFIGCEYGLQWLEFLKSNNIDWPTNPNPTFEPVAPTDNSLLAFVQARISEFNPDFPLAG